jgi:2''-aminoglycoside nucleotidyltransferase
LLEASDAVGLPLWLESGWAVDARLGRITREHEDIDFAVPAERTEEFKAILRAHGATGFEEMDYGFLVRIGNVLLDCEPCRWTGAAYEFEGVPPGSCPMEKQGVIAGVPVRCTSWPAILWEYFYYLDEVPYSEWPSKDKESYRVVRQAIGEEWAEELHALFRAGQLDAG